MKHLAPLAFASVLLAAACSATVDLSNRSCPCATGWQCCSNGKCVEERSVCQTQNLAPPWDASSGPEAGTESGDAATPPRTLASYCEGDISRRQRCNAGDASGLRCPSDIACVYSVMTHAVVADALGCSESRACSASDDPCWGNAFSKVRTAQDNAWSINCASRLQECKDGGISISSEICTTPASVFKDEVRAETANCFSKTSCAELKTCLQETFVTKGCDGF